MLVVDQFRLYKCCVIIASYNNAGTVEQVIHDVLSYCPDVFVVNDGSTDHTAAILSGISGIKVLTFEQHHGKGNALRKAFDMLRETGFVYAITLDGDGKHSAKELPLFLAELGEVPNNILIGARHMPQDNIPGAAGLLMKFNNFCFRFVTGIDLPQYQSGYRLYPLASLQKIFLFSRRNEFEVEVLVKAVWNGIGLTSICLEGNAPTKDEPETPYSHGASLTRIAGLHIYLLVLALVWYKPKEIILHFPERARYFWKHYFLAAHESNFTKAASVGFGVFMGIIPVWGFQMLLAGFFAHLMRLNKVITVVCSNISLPMNIPWIIYGSLKCGELLLGKQSGAFEWSRKLVQGNALNYALQYLCGSLLFAALLGLSSFIITYTLLSLFRRQQSTPAD
jgi:uncharacterized protein (DUF2062 family)